MLYYAIPRAQAVMSGFAWDLVQDYRIGRAFSEGYNPYTPEGRARADLAFSVSAIGHPPSSVLFLVPLATAVDLDTARLVVGWLSAFLVLAELMLLLRALGCPAPNVNAWLAFGFVLSLPLFRYHVSVGQMSAAIGFLVFASWAAARRGEDVLAGISLGAACMLKFFPGLLVLLFLLWRRWRIVAAALAVYIAAVVVTAVRFGLSSWLIFFANERNIAGKFIGSIQNQSVFGIVTRLFRPTCQSAGGLVPEALVIATLVGVVLIAAASWRATRVRSEEGRDAAFATFTVLALVTPQWTWEHYDVIYIVPVALMVASLAREWRDGRKRWGAAIGLTLVAAAVASFTIPLNLKVGYQNAVLAGARQFEFQLHLYEVMNWLPGVVLLGVVGRLLWRVSRV
jgi:hypothetical protein